MQALHSFGRLAAALLLASTFAAPVSAQQQSQAADPPIVVTGARLTPQEARARAVAFVRGTGVAAGNRPVARWLDPVCINVIGISARHAEIVKGRLTRIAVAAGVPVARGGCENNVAVIFTENAGEAVREIERRSSRRLSEVTGAARQRLVEGNAPIRWWYSTEPRGHQGGRQSTNAPSIAQGELTSDGTGTSSAPSGGGSVLPNNVPNLYQYNSSIISTQVARGLTSASVIVDVNTMRLPLEAVAAYVAMVAFAEIRENDFTSPASIMGMFEEGANPPRALTDWDIAFLRVLYRIPLDREARRHRGILVRDLLAAVEAGS